MSLSLSLSLSKLQAAALAQLLVDGNVTFADLTGGRPYQIIVSPLSRLDVLFSSCFLAESPSGIRDNRAASCTASRAHCMTCRKHIFLFDRSGLLVGKDMDRGSMQI